MPLTPSQSKALSKERHLAITANAGSGKTRILVDRYIKLFEEDPDLTPRNVVAITFTENAGAELRTRVLQEVNKRVAASSSDNLNVRHRLISLRDGLSSAFIGTIHGFASRLLRAYPVESKVDANFSILTGADQRILLEEVIGTTFVSALEVAYKMEAESPILHAFRVLGRKEVTNLVLALLRNGMRTEHLRRTLLIQADAEIIAYWNEEIYNSLDFIFQESTAQYFRELEGLIKKGKRGDDVRPLFATFLGAQTKFRKIQAFANLADGLTTKGQLQTSRVDIERIPGTMEADQSRFLSFYNAAEKLLKSWPATEEEEETGNRDYLKLLRAIFDLYDRVVQAYESRKQMSASMDFTDLMTRLESLLRDPRVVDELIDQFRFIMIDEYQDTDAGQFELARLLTDSFGTRNNLMIVGDPKQSIYAFRNADASVFRRTESEIRGQALTLSALSESAELQLSVAEERGEIVLQESFRMSESPMAFINILFRSILKPDQGLPFAVLGPEHSELIQGRRTAGVGSVEVICSAAPPKVASKALQEHSETSDEEDFGDEAEEAELIALKILQMIGPSEGRYMVEKDDTLRPAKAEDIAILLRSRTRLPSIEKALREKEIPYVVSKGAGFFGQQEILDITGYLSFLIHPSDDIALAGVLRSPFFATSEVDLYQIAHHALRLQPAAGARWGLWEKFQSYCEASSTPHLQRTLAQLRDNLALTGRTGAAPIVEKIFAETGIYATLLSGNSGRQKVANLEKFLALARASDGSGFSSIFDFIERTQYLVREDENESQADFSAETGAVSILTVHGAKGLEFPIVIIPFLQKKFQFDSSGTLDPALGLQIKLPDGNRTPIIAQLIRERSKANTIAEEKRVFYVATTRARDHLVLSCTIPSRSQKDTWLAWVAEAVPAVSDRELKSVSIQERIARYDVETRAISDDIIQFEIPLIRTAADIEVPAPESDAATTSEDLGTLYLGSLPVPRTTSRLSPTQFLRFKECPTKYHLAYSLGMPIARTVTGEFSAEDLDLEERPALVRGNVLGQIVHLLLSRIEQVAPQRTLDRMEFERALDLVFFELKVDSEPERVEYRPKVLDHIQAALNSEVAEEIFSTTAETEYAIQAQFETGDLLFGIIDRLFCDPRGIWTIVDYKTERVSSFNHPQDGGQRYAFQLKFYAYLVHLQHPDAEEIHAILFYTSTGAVVRFTFLREELSQWRSEVRGLIDALRSNERVTELLRIDRNYDHCPECGFFDSNSAQCIVLAARTLEADRDSRQIPELAEHSKVGAVVVNA